MAAFGSTGVSDFSGGGGMENILKLLTQGTDSPLLMEILKPLLAIQERGFGDQSRDLTDQFRKAGALRGGSYGVAVPRLMGDQSLAKSALIGQTASGMLGPLLQALLSSQQMSMKGSASGGSNPWAGIPPSQGLQTLGGMGSTSLPNSYGGSGWSPEAPLNLDELMSRLGGGGFGSSDLSKPQDFINYNDTWMNVPAGGDEGWY